jgi:hypothetical protein
MMSVKPDTLEECVKVLKCILQENKDYDYFVSMSFDDLISLHHGLGRWIRNEWGLWRDPATEEGKLCAHMIDLGFEHADDMSQTIIEYCWSKYKEQEYDLEERVIKFRLYWKEMRASTQGQNAIIDLNKGEYG